MKPIAVALGDPSGIGPEIVAAAWARRGELALPPFVAIGCGASIEAIWSGPLARIAAPDEAAATFAAALPLLQIDACADFAPGQPTLSGARAALDALELATGLARSGAASALVTAPVSKQQLYAIGFAHPGQTEFIAERCGVAHSNVAMMMAGPTLRTVPVTIHEPLARVPTALRTELIVGRARVVARALQRDFSIEAPRLAVAGLNPHAGEGGQIGSEEIDIITPAIAELRAEGWDVRGPLPADTLFHAHARASYDAALCMYHDQALIPIKTLHFDEGVNVTLGLPIVRTSPDHGTAFEIAGRNLARPDAFIAALRLASECAERRSRHG